MWQDHAGEYVPTLMREYWGVGMPVLYQKSRICDVSLCRYLSSYWTPIWHQAGVQSVRC